MRRVLLVAGMVLAVPAAHATVRLVSGDAPAVPAALWPIARGGATDAHFAAANTSRDGRLTWEQARNADWPQIANRFAAIDTAGRGWVTLAQVHAFLRAEHSRRRNG